MEFWYESEVLKQRLEEKPPKQVGILLPLSLSISLINFWIRSFSILDRSEGAQIFLA